MAAAAGVYYVCQGEHGRFVH